VGVSRGGATRGAAVPPGDHAAADGSDLLGHHARCGRRNPQGTEFRAKEALPAILEAISLPGELPFELYGDAITEDLAGVLAALAEDTPELIEALIPNRSLNQYVRWAAADTFLYFVRDGRLTRDQAVERLRVLFRDAIANEDHDIATILVVALDNFSPREALEEIRQAYALDLVNRQMIRLSSVEQSVADGDARVQETLEDCPPTGFDDAVEYMRGWYRHAEAEKRREQLVNEAAMPGPELDLDEDWAPPDTIVHTAPRVGRNAPCPCGSGKKFKKCCGGR
jgi:Protein of unknown function (DUF1186)/SEC-C motif